MAAILTDQLRILNAKDFVASVASTSNSFYSFVGLPNPTDVDASWDSSPPDPRDKHRQRSLVGKRQQHAAAPRCGLEPKWLSSTDVRDGCRERVGQTKGVYRKYLTRVSE